MKKQHKRCKAQRARQRRRRERFRRAKRFFREYAAPSGALWDELKARGFDIRSMGNLDPDNLGPGFEFGVTFRLPDGTERTVGYHYEPGDPWPMSEAGVARLRELVEREMAPRVQRDSPQGRGPNRSDA
jgi:hypothetical protein